MLRAFETLKTCHKNTSLEIAPDALGLGYRFVHDHKNPNSYDSY